MKLKSKLLYLTTKVTTSLYFKQKRIYFINKKCFRSNVTIVYLSNKV